jgi:hypothetical protein
MLLWGFFPKKEIVFLKFGGKGLIAPRALGKSCLHTAKGMNDTLVNK